MDIEVIGDEEEEEQRDALETAEQEIVNNTSPTETTRESQREPNQQHDIPPVLAEDDETQSYGNSLASKNSSLASPAVRRILNEKNISLSDVKGSGKHGYVLKDDVEKHIHTQAGLADATPSPSFFNTSRDSNRERKDRRVILSPIQNQMFQSMSRSLSIPHFLYSQIVDLTAVTRLREQLSNNPSPLPQLQDGDMSAVKLTLLPFILKALSQALTAYPALNSVLDTESDPKQPQFILKSSHNIGLAVDTPKGLLVPVIRDVQDHSIVSLSMEISRLSTLAKAGKLGPDDMKEGTIVVSNIGSIGGHTVAPVILAPMTAILAIGKVEQVPAFQKDKNGNEQVVKRNRAVLSWSADHRVLDGATVARCSQKVVSLLESIEGVEVILR